MCKKQLTDLQNRLAEPSLGLASSVCFDVLNADECTATQASAASTLLHVPEGKRRRGAASDARDGAGRCGPIAWTKTAAGFVGGVRRGRPCCLPGWGALGRWHCVTACLAHPAPPFLPPQGASVAPGPDAGGGGGGLCVPAPASAAFPVQGAPAVVLLRKDICGLCQEPPGPPDKVR